MISINLNSIYKFINFSDNLCFFLKKKIADRINLDFEYIFMIFFLSVFFKLINILKKKFFFRTCIYITRKFFFFQQEMKEKSERIF